MNNRYLYLQLIVHEFVNTNNINLFPFFSFSSTLLPNLSISETLLSLNSLRFSLNLWNSFLYQSSLVILAILGGGFWWWCRSEFGSISGWISDGCLVGDGLLGRSVARSVMVGGWIEVWSWVSVAEIGVWWWVSFTKIFLPWTTVAEIWEERWLVGFCLFN